MWETIVLPALMGLIGHNLKQLHDSSIDWGEQKWSEIETKFNSTFGEYYQTVYNHYKEVPYLLNADVKVSLLEIYQPSFLIDHREDEKEVLTDSLDKVLAKGNHIWIDGHGGIGKTTMLKYFLLHRLTVERKTDDMRIPVYVELRRYNEDKYRKEHFMDFIYTLMQSENFTLELKYFKHMVEQGRFVFLLDAFDEVHSEYQSGLAYQLLDFIKQYPVNAVLISSRHLINYAINHPSFLRLETQGLEQDQAVSLIEKIDVSGTRLSEEIKEEFVAKLRDRDFFKTYQSFIANPILLLLMLKTFNSNKNFPKERAKFLLESYDYLYKEHDNNKMVSYNDREFKTNLNQETLKRVLSSFCFELYFRHSEQSYVLSKHQLTDVLREVKEYEAVGDFERDDFLHDLTTCLSVLYCEGDNYFFVHNVFKEFFAAYYLYQEYSSDELASFFRQAILEGRTDWRVIETTLVYFAELDTIYQKSRLDLEVILFVLDEIYKEKSIKKIDVLLTNQIKLMISAHTATITPVSSNYLSSDGKIILFLEYCLHLFFGHKLYKSIDAEHVPLKYLLRNYSESLTIKKFVNNYITTWADYSIGAINDFREMVFGTDNLEEVFIFLYSNRLELTFVLFSEDCTKDYILKQFLENIFSVELKILNRFYYELQIKKEEQSRRLSRRMHR